METKYKVILHILLYLLTFFAYLKALEWAIEHGRARVPTSDAMGQGMKDALNTLVYTVLAIAVVYVVSMLITKFLLKGSILLSACINGGLILLWIAIFVFASRNQKVRPISDYLIVEINTPCLYPITVCDCKITLPNGDAYRLGRKVDKLIAVEGDAWGKGGGEKIYILSDSLPSHIDISYLSYVEDKVYHVEEDLPVEKINKLYHERWLNGWNEEQRYDGLVIGCAPYGSVQIWLRSDIHGGRRTEVCSFKGKEESEALWGYKMDCDGFYYKYDKEKVRNEVWENLKANGLPDTLFFNNSHIRYNYRIVVETESMDDKLHDMELVLCNGEYDNTSQKQIPDCDYKMQVCPKYIRLEWQNRYKSTCLDFKPNEIFDFFSSSFGGDCSQPGDFVIQLNKSGELKNISLKIGKNIYIYDKEAGVCQRSEQNI